MIGSDTTIFVFRSQSDASGVDLEGLDVTTPWDQLSSMARGSLLEAIRSCLDDVAEDAWRHYETATRQLDLSGAWWVDGGWPAFQELFARVSRALGYELGPGDIVAVDDTFVLLTSDSAWRPLLPSVFVSQLHHLGKGREPPPPPPRRAHATEVQEKEALADREIPEVEETGKAPSWPVPQFGLQPLVQDAVEKAQPLYEPLLDSLPATHQEHARAVVEEFFENDLKNGLSRSDLSTDTGHIRALRKLLSLAVERETIVTITYRQEVLGPALASHRELRRAMVRIWDDEVYHEVYFRMVQDRALRPKLDSLGGRVGGKAAAVLANEESRRLERAKAEAVKLGGRLSGKLGPETARGMRASSPSAYCAHNVALEVTACLAYNVMAMILFELSGLPKPLRMDPARLAMKVFQISGQELEHAQMFRDICLLLEGAADAPTNDRLDRATRIVLSAADWRTARGAAATPPDECRQPEGEPSSAAIDPILDALVPTHAALEADMRASRAPSMCIQSPVDVNQPLSDEAWGDVEAVARWLARWCTAHSIEAAIYIVDGKPGRLDDREALTISTGALAAPGAQFADVAILSTHNIQSVYLTAQGGFYTSDADILHRVWWGWAEAQLRVAVTSLSGRGPFLIENLRGLIMPSFDLWLGPGIDPLTFWYDVPGLADVAGLRLLGGYPPQIALCRVPAGGTSRRSGKEDVVVSGPDALAVDRHAAELTGTKLEAREVYAIADLLDD